MGCAPTNHARRTVPYGKSKTLENQQNKAKIDTPVKRLQTDKKQPSISKVPSSSLLPLPKSTKVKYAQPLRDMVIKDENRKHKVNHLDFNRKEHFLPF